MNIFVARLDYGVEEDELRTAFEAYGEVSSVKIVMDRETGRSKGFGFVEMPSSEDGNTAVEALDGTELRGRAIVAKEARPQESRGGGGGGRGGFNRGGGNSYDRGGRDSYNRDRY